MQSPSSKKNHTVIGGFSCGIRQAHSVTLKTGPSPLLLAKLERHLHKAAPFDLGSHFVREGHLKPKESAFPFLFFPLSLCFFLLSLSFHFLRSSCQAPGWQSSSLAAVRGLPSAWCVALSFLSGGTAGSAHHVRHHVSKLPSFLPVMLIYGTYLLGGQTRVSFLRNISPSSLLIRLPLAIYVDNSKVS